MGWIKTNCNVKLKISNSHTILPLTYFAINKEIQDLIYKTNYFILVLYMSASVVKVDTLVNMLKIIYDIWHITIIIIVITQM